MAIEQQLVDYIKDARKAKQSDDQTRALLYKNGWTESEVREAFMYLTQEQPAKPEAQPQIQQQQPQPQTQPAQPQIQPQITQQRPQVRTAQPQSAKTQPQSQYKPQYQPSQTMLKTTRSPRPILSLLMPLSLLFILIVTIGGGVYVLYSGIYNPSWNPFKSNNFEIISKAWENIQSVKSGNFNIEIALSGVDLSNSKIIEPLSFNANFKVTGRSDNTDTNNPMSHINITSNASAPGEQNKFDFTFSIESILANNNFYLKLNGAQIDAPQFSYLPLPTDTITDKWTNKWMKFNLSEIQGQVMMTQTIGENQKQAQKMLNDMWAIAINKKVFDIKQIKDNDSKASQEYHYSLSVNRKNLNSALPEIHKVLLNYNNQIPNQAEFEIIINKIFDSLGQFSIDVYIGKDDLFFHKIQFNNTIDINKFDVESMGKIILSMTISYTNINQPVQIIEPENYQNSDDFLADILTDNFVPAEISENMGNIMGASQIIFDEKQSYADLCYKKLLNGYQETFGEELINWNNAIVATGATKPTCYANVENYCVSTQLAENGFICIGPNSVGLTECESDATICK